MSADNPIDLATARLVYNLGLAHHKQGNASEALDCFEKAARLDPVFEKARHNAAALAQRLGRKTANHPSNTVARPQNIDETIAYLTQVVTLEPGDLIFTGTPPGVGMARKPPVWLQPGDVVEVEIDGLGMLRNPVARR